MRAKMSPTSVRFVRYVRGEVRQHVLATALGVKQNTISRAQTRTTWRDVR